MSICSLLEVYRENTDGCRTIVLKHLPDDADENDLHNYLERVCKSDVKDVRVPASGCGVAIVTFTDIVDDSKVQKWQERAVSIDYQGCYPTLELLVNPTGLFATGVPDKVTDELLLLYFESSKSGGIEGTVDKAVERVTIKSNRHAIIPLTSEQAIASILSQQSHKLQETEIAVGPFYPNVHRPILETLESRETVKEAVAPFNTHDNIIERDVMQGSGQINFGASSAMTVAPVVAFVDNIGDSDRNVQQGTDDSYVKKRKAATPFPQSNRDQAGFLDYRPARSGRKVATVKPVVYERDTSEIPSTAVVNNVKYHASSPVMDFEQDIDLPSYKIELLKTIRFEMKYETERLVISLNEKEGKIRFQANSFDEFKEARNQMYQCLDKVIVKVKKLSDHKYTFLSRKQCLDCLRSKCKAENIKVVYETDNDRQEIRIHSFSEKDAVRGIGLLGDEVTTDAVKIRPEQQTRLRTSAWYSLKSSLDRDITNVYLAETDTHIYIESLSDSKAKEAKRKILLYLNDSENSSKKIATVTLESSKARCFKACLEDKLRQEIKKRNGTLNVIQQSGNPLKLKVSAEGDETATDEMEKVVQQIWHENVDFNIVSASAEDTWLIMNGLDGQLGKDFLRKFEQNHNCFLEVSKHGDFLKQKARVKVEDVTDSSDEDELVKTPGFAEAVDSESEKGATARVFTKDNRSDRRRNRGGGRFSQYQQGMNEKEAIEMAMKRSVQSTTEEKLDTGIESLCNDSNSDSEQETVKGDVFENNFERPDILFEESQSPEVDSWQMSKSGQDKRFEPEIAQTIIKTRTITVGNSTVKLVHGAVVKQRANALVNVVSATRGLSEGAVSKSFVDMGGEDLSQMYEYAKSSTSGVVTTRSSGQLKCSTVVHVHLQRSEHCQKIVRRAVSDVLEECNNWGCKTVAFPPLGVGQMFGFPPAVVAETMLEEIYRQLETKKYDIKQAALVIYNRDVYKIFDSAFEAFSPTTVRFGKGVDPQKAQASSEARSFSEVRQRPPSGARRHALPPGGQEKNRQLATRGRSNNAAQRSRGTHSSSSSSSHSRDSGDRKMTTSNNTNQTDNKPRKNSGTREMKESRQSRYPTGKPVPNFKVKVVAEGKDKCIQGRNAFSEKLKEKFLHEETIDKKQKISTEAKQKIAHIVTSNDIKSIKGKGSYILKGQKGNVQKANTEILKVLLEEKNSLDVQRKRKANTKRETKEFVEVMVNDEPEVPSYWKNYKQGETLKSLLMSAKQFLMQKKFEAVEVNKDTYTFSSVVKMVNATFDPSLVGQGKDAVGLDSLYYDKLFVLKVERIENLHLYEQFTVKRQKLFRRLHASRTVRFPKLDDIPKCSRGVATSRHVRGVLGQDLHPEINEHLLFHGTKDSNVKVICNYGLDPRLGSGNAMFGPGIYAAESATKADQYADEKSNRSAGKGSHKKMFLIRMVLGNSFLCTDPNPQKYRRPPCTQCHKDDCRNANHGRGRFGNAFDSVVGDNKKLFREFVVYDNSLCYPEYLITYERR